MITVSDVAVDQSGVYDDMPDDVYHADPVPGGSLSSSGARKLLPPSCPAIFDHERRNGRAPKKTFDIGHAAHKLVLGTGPELVLVDRERWDTKDCKAEVAAIRERGGVPLKRAEFETVHEMAAAIRRHPLASALFDPGTGAAEQSLFWRDEETGVWCRARLDWLRNRAPGRLIVVDYKTTNSADRDSVRKSAYDYGYHQQDPWYLDGVRALGLADDAAFVFVFQEKTAPYLVTVVELDEPAREVGRAANRRARHLYAECAATGIWPGYSDDIELISLPPWAARNEEHAA